MIYGITYIDHQTKCIFNGSVPGKQYSAKAIQERCLQVMDSRQNSQLRLASEPIGLQPRATATAAETKPYHTTDEDSILFTALGNLLDMVMQSESISDYLPGQLKGRQEKYKRKKHKP